MTTLHEYVIIECANNTKLAAQKIGVSHESLQRWLYGKAGGVYAASEKKLRAVGINPYSISAYYKETQDLRELRAQAQPARHIDPLEESLRKLI